MRTEATIKKLLELEEELKSAEPCLERDAKVNILKYLQVQTVNRFQEAYDGLYYELNKNGGLGCLRNIVPTRSKDFLQPKVLDRQLDGGASGLTIQAEAYLASAELAKPRLDEIARRVVENLEGCHARCVGVKTLESTVRKAKDSYDGNLRKVADMARVAVICDTPEHLEQVYEDIVEIVQVSGILAFGTLNRLIRAAWSRCSMSQTGFSEVPGMSSKHTT